MSPALLSLAKVAVGSALIALGLWSRGVAAGTPATCTNPQLSCQSTSTAGTCCFSAPGGQILLTQFWDTNPSVGEYQIM